jgi:DNA-binding beta-propeller fold protein YncE
MIDVIDTGRDAASRGRRQRRIAVGMLAGAAALVASACGGPTSASTRTPSPTAGSQTVETLPPSPAVSPTGTATPVAGTSSPAPSPTGSTTATPASANATAYVALDNGTLESLDVQTEVIGAPIPIGHTPAALAITPDGSTAYVADADTGGVTVVDLGTGTIEKQIVLSTAGAPLTAIAISPDGATAYVAVGETSASTGMVIPITVATASVGSPISVGPDPTAIAITPDGQSAYVVDNASTTITPIDLANGIVGSPLQVGTGPVAIAISPTASDAYVLGAGVDDTLTPVKLATDPAEDGLASPITAGSGVPQAVAIAPDGSSAFVAETDDALQVGLPSGTTLWSTGNAAYNAVAISPDGSTAVITYTASVLSQSGLIAVDVSTGKSLGSLALDGNPVAIAFATSPGRS